MSHTNSETFLSKAANTVITDTVWEEVKCSQTFWTQKGLIHKKTTVLERHAGTFRGAEQILAAIRAQSSTWGKKNNNPEDPDMD